MPPTESTMYPGVCPDDSQGEYRERYSWLPYKGHCYLFVTDMIEWADAVSSCVRHGKWQKQPWTHLISGALIATLYHMYYLTYFVCSEGGVLASIEDPDEQQFIESNLEIFKDSLTSFWIGLYKTHRGMDTFLLQVSRFATKQKETKLQLTHYTCQHWYETGSCAASCCHRCTEMKQTSNNTKKWTRNDIWFYNQQKKAFVFSPLLNFKMSRNQK